METPGSTVTPLLAIIVPAYKTRFLRAALNSIAAQTSRSFQLYVFDDASEEPVAEIVGEFSAGLPLRFHRFENNLGGESLVQHLARCVQQTVEPWVWIFADDDVMEAGCVENFLAELERTPSAHELYRFNTVWIDSAGKQISESPVHPPLENGADFLLARLAGARNGTLQEIIFSRRAWDAEGGLPDFALGWHADEAFTASLGVRQPLRTIAGARIHWRVSDWNLSSAASFAVTNQKILASAEFFRWVVKFFQAHAAPQLAAAKRVSARWLVNYVRTCWEFIGLRTCLVLDQLAAEMWQRPRGWGLALGLRANLRLALHKIFRSLNRWK